MGNINKKQTRCSVTNETGFLLSEPENEKAQQIFFHNLNEMVRMGIIDSSDFEPFYEVIYDGRKMVVLPFSKHNHINKEKLQIWKLIHKYPEMCEIVNEQCENALIQ